MSKKDLIKKEIEELTNEGLEFCEDYLEKSEEGFQIKYQVWYSKALKVIEFLAPDRYKEFRGYYEIDPKRKAKDFGGTNYVIQDFIKNNDIWDWGSKTTKELARNCFINQIAIFSSLSERVDSILSNIETELFSELQDDEISTAKQLLKINIRAAGSLLGVIIENHLKKVANSHKLKILKKNPTISDLNELLKKEAVITAPNWRKITYMGDIRNLCTHKKEVEPTKEEVSELINNTDWLVKNVF